MLDRPEFTDRTMRKIRNAQAELVEGVGPAKAMEITHLSKTVIYRYADEHAPDLISIPNALKLEAHFRRPVLTQELVSFHGGEFSPSSRVAASDTNLTLHVAELVDQAGRIVVETARAKADGVVTIAEATRILDLVATMEALLPVIKDTLVAVQVAGPLREVSAR